MQESQRGIRLGADHSASVARILIVGGGCRGRRLASELAGEGHALRITAREERGRAAIESAGAECWIGTPDRLATLRGALENVTLACWLLGSASGSAQQLEALRSSRLQAFMRLLIDTTVRGFIYEAVGPAIPAGDVSRCEQIVRAVAERNAIPVAALTATPGEVPTWLAQARAAVRALLGPQHEGRSAR
jgi:uncharacterized protein YbjT (DUF2867 family)